MTQVKDVYPDDRVSLREVGLRDGLQLVKKFPSIAGKQRWVRDEYGAGVRHFEVGSFLPAKTFPQFADVREVVKTVASLPGAHGIALALNERGVNEALASGVAEIASVVSATEEHSRANANRSREEAIANVRRLCELPDATGNVVFEDLVFLCESKEFATGIDIEKLVAVRSILRVEMPHEALYGGLARAGLPDRKSSVAA